MRSLPQSRLQRRRHGTFGPELAGIAVASVLLVGMWRASAADGSKAPDYNRDIRPILSEHCYACHGPDEGRRKARMSAPGFVPIA